MVLRDNNYTEPKLCTNPMETIIVKMLIANKATHPVFNVFFAINIKSLYREYRKKLSMIVLYLELLVRTRATQSVIK